MLGCPVLTPTEPPRAFYLVSIGLPAVSFAMGALLIAIHARRLFQKQASDKTDHQRLAKRLFLPSIWTFLGLILILPGILITGFLASRITDHQFTRSASTSNAFTYDMHDPKYDDYDNGLRALSRPQLLALVNPGPATTVVPTLPAFQDWNEPLVRQLSQSGIHSTWIGSLRCELTTLFCAPRAHFSRLVRVPYPFELSCTLPLEPRDLEFLKRQHQCSNVTIHLPQPLDAQTTSQLLTLIRWSADLDNPPYVEFSGNQKLVPAALQLLNQNAQSRPPRLSDIGLLMNFNID
jgi:hypothetical protein